MYYKVYILFSLSKKRYYIGHTGDILDERLRRHNTNHNGYTGKTRDWNIVYLETFHTKAEANKREREIKNWKSRKRIENLITGSKHPDL